MMGNHTKLSLTLSQRILAACVIVLAWTACNPDRSSYTDPKGQVALEVTATLPDDRGLRAIGTSWDSGDRIGIYAINNQSDVGSSTIVNGYDNVAYETPGNGAFHAVTKAIQVSPDGAMMDLVAYYPYKPGITNYSYPIDLNEQVDLFYSKNAVGIGASNNRPQLQFSHVLSQLKLNISSTNGQSLDGLTVMVENTPLRGAFSLSDGQVTIDTSSQGSLKLAVADGSSPSVKTVKGLLFPGVSAKTMNVKFMIGSQSFTWTIPVQMEPAKYYEYNIQLDEIAHVTEVYHGLPEIPKYANGGQAPDAAYAMHLVTDQRWLSSIGAANTQKRNFTVLYNKKERVPYWVAYPLHPIYLGHIKRQDAWGFDPLIPKDVQPDVTRSWHHGYDRGHLMASADRTASKALNRTTFYFTNQAAQASKMNQGTWNQLEGRVREWCNQTATYDTLYVVTGCILPLSPEKEYIRDNNSQNSLIPKYYYKALMRQNKKTKKYSTIVFCVRNAAQHDPYSRSIISVEELERRTGFKFFLSIPKDQAAEAKRNTSMSEWN